MDDNILNEPEKEPDDISGIVVEAHFRISDPESGEVLVEGRA